jgi:hypothetical protein
MVHFGFITSAHRHRERRKFLRTTLKELGLILTDQPGLLGPKVCVTLHEEESLFAYTLTFEICYTRCKNYRTLTCVCACVLEDCTSL